jgi:raffinose/stachyose/melibiose transport system permease protein
MQPRKNLLSHLILGAWTLIAAVPFIWLAISSVRDNTQILAQPLGLPSSLDFSNYASAWKQGAIGTGFLNSLIVTLFSVLASILLSAMISYVISRMSRSMLLYTFMTAGIMIPLQAIVIPVFIILRDLHLNNSLLGLILVNTVAGIPLGVLILVGFFSSIPQEMEDAAFVDGASRSLTFFKIILPMAKPGLATVGTLTFINVWNEYLFAFVLNTSQRVKVLTQSIRAVQGTYSTDFGMVTASVMIMVIPLIIFFVFLQEQVIHGLTAGAVKG